MRKYKRDHPRLARSLPVKLEPPAGDAIYAETHNISRGGMQIGCDRIVVHIVFPQFEDAHSAPAQGATQSDDFGVHLTLPASEPTPGVIEGRCQPVFAQQIAEGRYRIGCKFTSLAPEANELLEDYIDECLELGIKC